MKSSMQRALHRLFRRDVGRKLMALLLALLLFVAIDRQVRDEMSIPLLIEYVPYAEIEDQTATVGWRLVIADDAPIPESDDTLVVRRQRERERVELRLFGPRAVIEAEQARPRVLTFEPDVSGELLITLEDNRLRGLSDVLARLGSDNVRLAEPIRLDVRRQVTRHIRLVTSHVKPYGTVASGWKYAGVATFEPPVLPLRGFQQELDFLEANPSALFEPVFIGGERKEVVTAELSLSEELESVELTDGQPPRASLALQKNLVLVGPELLGGRPLTLPVALRWIFAELSPELQDRLRAGERPQLTRSDDQVVDEAGQVLKQIELYLPEDVVEAARSGGDLGIDSILERVELIARLEEYGEVNQDIKVRVAMVPADDASRDAVQVKVVRGVNEFVKVEWVKPDAAPPTDEGGEGTGEES